MSGWKTIVGSVLVAIGTLLVTLPPMFEGQATIGEVLLGFGASLGVVGIGHKLDKVSALFIQNQQ
jgi:drug/metabolite transporter (DMT)-like permease